MADFAPLTPAEMQIQQQAIDRQRKLAEYLQQQSLTPEQGQMISGHYVPPSNLSYLNKIAQALVGSSDQKSLDKKQLELVTQQGDALRGQFGIGNTPSVQLPPQAGAQSGAPSIQAVAAELQNPGKAASSGMVLPGMDPRIAFQAFNTDPKGYYAKLLEFQAKNNEDTTEMKNARWMGRSPQELAAAARAADQKAAMYETQPGARSTNLLTGQTTFNPKVGDGITIDQAGNASAVPGYGAANASLEAAKAGAVTNATEAAKLPFQPPTTYNAKGGPVALTPAQAIAAATGGQSPGAQGLDLSKLTPQQQAFLAQKDPTAFANGVADFQQTGRPQVGIPLEDPIDQKRKETALGINAGVVTGQVKDAEAQRGILSTLDTVEGLIKGGTLGNTLLDKVQMGAHNLGMKQTPETIRTANLQKLGDQLVLARGSLGAGVSVADAERYDKAAGDLSHAKSNAERLQYIQIMRDIAKKSFDNTNKNVQSFNDTGKIAPFGATQSSVIDFGSLR